MGHHGVGKVHLVHAVGVDAPALQVGAAQLQQGGAAEAATVVVELGFGVEAVLQSLGNAGHAGFVFVAHRAHAGDVGVATSGSIAVRQLVEHFGLRGSQVSARADQLRRQLGHSVARAQLGNVGGALGGLCSQGCSVDGGSGGRCGCAAVLVFRVHTEFLCGLLGGCPDGEFAGRSALLGCAAGAAAGICRNGDKTDFSGRPAGGAVQPTGAAVGALLGRHHFHALHAVASADVADHAAFDVGHQAGQLGAFAQAHSGAAFGAVKPSALNDANDALQAPLIVRVEHAGASVHARQVNCLSTDHQLFVVRALVAPVKTRHDGAGCPHHFHAVGGVVKRGGVQHGGAHHGRHQGLRVHRIGRGGVGRFHALDGPPMACFVWAVGFTFSGA